MTYESEIEESRERFFSDTKGHEMTVLHNQGLYRHVRFCRPERGAYWFDLITWPDCLAIRGDIGKDYVFARRPQEDMFEFFSSGIYKDGSLHINPGYWEDKLHGNRDSAREYSKERLFNWVKTYLEEGNVDDVNLCSDIQTDLEYHDENGMLETMEDAHHWLTRWEHGRDRYGDDKRGVWSDTWDINLQGYDFWFLWACWGIVWGVQQFTALHGLPGMSQDTFRAQDVATMGVRSG